MGINAWIKKEKSRTAYQDNMMDLIDWSRWSEADFKKASTNDLSWAIPTISAHKIESHSANDRIRMPRWRNIKLRAMFSEKGLVSSDNFFSIANYSWNMSIVPGNNSPKVLLFLHLLHVLEGSQLTIDLPIRVSVRLSPNMFVVAHSKQQEVAVIYSSIHSTQQVFTLQPIVPGSLFEFSSFQAHIQVINSVVNC